jgi:hypothetical protein
MKHRSGSAQARVALLDRAALFAGGALVCEEHHMFHRPAKTWTLWKAYQSFYEATLMRFFSPMKTTV